MLVAAVAVVVIAAAAAAVVIVIASTDRASAFSLFSKWWLVAQGKCDTHVDVTDTGSVILFLKHIVSTIPRALD